MFTSSMRHLLPVTFLKRWRAARVLAGKPEHFFLLGVFAVHDIIRWRALGFYVWYSRSLPGWTRGREAAALAKASYRLPEEPVLVEIGSFLGVSAVLLAGGRRLKGSGRVHCVDPFDCSGDPFSVPFYQAFEANSLRSQFDTNIRRVGLAPWITVHQGCGEDVGITWKKEIDLLFLDGDQSYRSVRALYDTWERFVKPRGVIALHNSRPGVYEEDHDGHAIVAMQELRPPRFKDIEVIGTTTFATKATYPETHERPS